MRATVGTGFDVIYLVLVIPFDIRMSQRSERGSQYWFFGLIAVLLGGAMTSTWFRA